MGPVGHAYPSTNRSISTVISPISEFFSATLAVCFFVLGVIAVVFCALVGISHQEATAAISALPLGALESRERHAILRILRW